MVVKNLLKNQEDLKEKILLSEEKKVYSSEKFQKIEEKVKDSLKKQATDEALMDITV